MHKGKNIIFKNQQLQPVGVANKAQIKQNVQSQRHEMQKKRLNQLLYPGTNSCSSSSKAQSSMYINTTDKPSPNIKLQQKGIKNSAMY